MTNRVEPRQPPVAEATAYPVGLTFNVTFDAFSVSLKTLPDDIIRFQIADGPYARTETVKVDVTLIRPGVFLVSWVEAGGATVVHIEDFAQGQLYSHATLPDGAFLRMQGPIGIVSQEAAQ